MFGTFYNNSTMTIVEKGENINTYDKILNCINEKLNKQCLNAYNNPRDNITESNDVMIKNMPNKSFNYIIYDYIIVNDKKIYFTKPVIFTIQYTSDGVIIKNDEYNIYAFGENVLEAKMDMYNEFVIMWDEYVNEDDANLTMDAIKFKNKLRSIINLYAKESK